VQSESNAEGREVPQPLRLARLDLDSRMVRGRRYRVNTDAPISRAGWDEAAEGEGSRLRAFNRLQCHVRERAGGALSASKRGFTSSG